MHAITDTFRISNEMNLYLLDAIETSNLAATAATKGRSVGEQFAHLHNVRLMWLKAAAPDLLDGLDKIEKENASDKKTLTAALKASAIAMQTLLERGAESGKIKGFKPHATAFLGYLTAHEAHHRGQILMILKQSGKLPDKKILFGLWEWGRFEG